MFHGFMNNPVYIYIMIFLINQLGRYARVVDHLAVYNVAQSAPLGGGSSLTTSSH